MQVSPNSVENQPTALGMETTHVKKQPTPAHVLYWDFRCEQHPTLGAHVHAAMPHAPRTDKAGQDIADRLCEPLTKGKAG